MACVDYFSAFAAGHPAARRRIPGTWSSTILPTRKFGEIQRTHGARAQDGIQQKFPLALRHLTPQFPTDGAAGLLVGCILVAACSGGGGAAVILSCHRRRQAAAFWRQPAQGAEAGGSGDPQLSPPPTVRPCGACWGRRGRGRVAKGDSFCECM